MLGEHAEPMFEVSLLPIITLAAETQRRKLRLWPDAELVLNATVTSMNFADGRAARAVSERSWRSQRASACGSAASAPRAAPPGW